MIKDTTAKSNNSQDLGDKIRYLKSQAPYESVLNRKLKTEVVLKLNKLLSNYVVV